MKHIADMIGKLDAFAVRVMKAGGILSIILYIAGFFCRDRAVGSIHFIELRVISRTLFEMAPALLAGCVAAALICDLILRDRRGRE